MKRKIFFTLLLIASLFFAFNLSGCKKDSTTTETTQTVTSTFTETNTPTAAPTTEPTTPTTPTETPTTSTTEYTISFDTLGGDEVESIKYKENEDVTLPTPTYASYVFMGWYLSSEYKEEVVSGKFSSNLTLYAKWGAKVSFETFDGGEISYLSVELGTAISNLPIATKEGNAFVGWYKDSSLKEEFDSSALIDSPITLYAKYSKNIGYVISKNQYFNGIDSVASIEIISSITLNNDNINDYFSLTNADGDSLKLVLSLLNEENSYSLKIKRGFIEGETYTLEALTNDTKFSFIGDNSIDSDTTKISFDIYKQTYDNISEVPRIHIVSTDIFHYSPDVRTLSLTDTDPDNGKTVSSIFVDSSKTFKEGDIISIGDSNTEVEDDPYYKVIVAETKTVVIDSNNKTLWYLEFISPELEDIYSSFDSYGTGEVDLSNYIDFTTESLKESVENSEGIETLSANIRMALIESPTVNELRNTLDEKGKAELDAKLQAFKITNLTLTFVVVGSKVKIGASFETEMDIQNVATLTLSISFSDTISLTFKHETRCIEDYYIGIIDKYYISVSTYFSNEFTFSLGAEIEFSGTGGKQTKVDIVDEVMGYIKTASSNVNDFAESLSGDALFKTSDASLKYVEVCSAPFGKIPIPLTNIITLSIDFNGVISLAGKAGVFIDVTQTYTDVLTIANGKINSDNSVTFFDDGFTVQQKELESNLNIKLTLKGKLGFRTGVEVKVKLSVAHLNDIASVYVSATVGPYVELTGMAVFEYNYDAIKKESTFNIYGGIYVNFGLFIDVKLGVDTLIYDSNTSLWTYKLKTFTYGDKYAFIKFSDKDRKVETSMSRTMQYKAYYRYELIDCLNLQTGEIEKEKYYTNLEIEYSLIDGASYNKYLTIDDKGYITISDDFKGTYLTFGIHIKLKNSASIIGKTIERDAYFTYMDPNNHGVLKSSNSYSFYNRYNDTYTGNFIFSTLFKVEAYIGTSPVLPVLTISDLPKRDGYYLDLDDLWLKYQDNTLVEDWDGTFSEAELTEPNIYYVLNWKQIKFDASYYLYKENDSGTLDKVLHYTDNNATIAYSGSSYSFFIKYYKESDAIYGYSFTSYLAPSYFDSYVLTVGEHDISGLDSGTYFVLSKGFKSVDEAMNFYNENGLELYGYYSKITYKVKFEVAETYYPSNITSYTVVDYPEGENISLVVPGDFKIGTLIRDILSISYYVSSDGTKFTSLDNVYVTKDETYKAYTTATYNTVTYKLEGDDYFDGLTLSSTLVSVGDAVPTYTDTEIDALVKEKLSSFLNSVDSYTLALDSTIPSSMTEGGITLYYKLECVYKEISVTFNNDYGLYDYKGHNSNSITYTGYYRTNDASASLTYTTPLPTKDVYFKEEDGILYKYSFAYYYDSTNDTISIKNFNFPFYKNFNFDSIYTKEAISFNIDFMITTAYGYTYTYSSLEGNFYGLTLAEIIASAKVEDPVITDYFGKYNYAFSSWDIPNDYVIGSDIDINSAPKTDYTINAIFTTTLKEYTIIIDANGGTFKDGDTTKTITGTSDDRIDLSSYVLTRPSDNDNSYRFIGWNLDNLSNYINTSLDGSYIKSDMVIYAVYSTSKLDRTLNFTVEDITGEMGGNGYFLIAGEILEKRTYTNLVDSEVLRIRQDNVHFESTNYSRVALYIQSTDGEYISYFIDGICEIEVDGDKDYVVYFGEATSRIYETTFYSISYLATPSDEEGEILGFINGNPNFYSTLKCLYNEEVTAPDVTYTGSSLYKFMGWRKPLYNADGSYQVDTDGNTLYETYQGGSTIKVTENGFYTAYYVYDSSVTYSITFNANVCYSKQSDLFLDTQISLHPCFSLGEGEITIKGLVDSDVVFDQVPTLSGFKFTGWTTYNGTSLDSLGTFSADRLNYYASYEKTSDKVLTIYSNDGAFTDNETKKTVSYPIGTILSMIDEIPTISNPNLAFSHFINSDGEIVNTVTKDEALYAVYAIKISSFSDLLKINDNPSGYYVLTANIKSYSETLSPLCAESIDGFSGVLNGAGHTIGYYQFSESKNLGLFSKLSGRVFDLSISSIFEIRNENKIESTVESAGLLASIITPSGIVEDCYFMGRITVASKVMDSFKTGIIAGVNNGTIRNCYVNTQTLGNTSIESDGKAYFGGVVGVNNGLIDNVIYKFSNYVLSVASNMKLYFGGIAGYNTGVISNSFAGGGGFSLVYLNGDNIFTKGSFIISSIAGYDKGTIKNCYYQYGLDYKINNITLTDPTDSTVTKKYNVTHSKAYDYTIYGLDYIPEKYVLREGTTFVRTFQVSDDYPFEYPDETSYLSTYLSKDKLTSFEGVFVYYPVASGDLTYDTVYDINKLPTTFDMIQSLTITESNYGYLNYLKKVVDPLEVILG